MIVWLLFDMLLLHQEEEEDPMQGPRERTRWCIQKEESPRSAARQKSVAKPALPDGQRCQLRKDKGTLQQCVFEACTMMFVHVGKLVHAAYKNVERDHLFPQFALLVHGPPQSKLAER